MNAQFDLKTGLVKEEKRTKTQILSKTKYSSSITIMEMIRPDDSRYFRAIICGWKNFCFKSDRLKSNPLFLRTIEKCKEIETQIKDGKIDTVPTNFNL